MTPLLKGLIRGRDEKFSGTAITSEAEAATERSEGVAGAKRSRSPENSPAGQALDTSEASRGRCPEGRWGILILLSHRMDGLYDPMSPIIYW